MKDSILKPRTCELYDGLLRNHLLPTFGGTTVLTEITLAGIRRWRKERLCSVRDFARKEWPFGAVRLMS